MKNYKIGEKYLIKHRMRGLYSGEYISDSVGICTNVSPYCVTLKISKYVTQVIYCGDIIEEVSA